MSEEPVFGAGVINCSEKEIEGELVPLAAVTLVFVTGFHPESTQRRRALGDGVACWQKK